MEKIVCVAGPTASGKTKLAVELAKAYDGEVLSCDSMQIYRGMAIGTAAPTPEEMQGVVHHMIGVADPGEDFSVGKYVELAEPVLQDILSRGKTCVVCGGTGLYADSLLLGRSFAPCPSTGMRETLEAEARQSGLFVCLKLGKNFLVNEKNYLPKMRTRAKKNVASNCVRCGMHRGTFSLIGCFSRRERLE